MEEEEDEEDEEMFRPDEDELGGRNGSWARMPPPPPLTEGATTSTSSSLSHSLSSQADDHLTAVDSAAAAGNLSSSGSAGSMGSMLTAAGGTSESGEYFTPQSYKHVLPLQAAFMSTGLVSKRARARDSGVGGMTPLLPYVAAPPAQQNIDLSSTSTFAAKTMPAHPLSTVLHQNPLASIPRVPSVMPDTPVKRSSFAHPLTAGIAAPSPCSSTSSSSSFFPLDPLHPLPQSRSPTSSDPVEVDTFNAGPPAASTPHGNVSPCSGRTSSLTGLASIGRVSVVANPNGEVSPSAHASRGSGGRIPPAQSQSAAAAGTIPWKRPAMFRRRSSGQLSSSWISNNTVHGSGESESSGSGFGNEPMTPTRSVGSRWSEGEIAIRLHTFLAGY